MDYSKSKYENATAERAYEAVLGGFAADTIGTEDTAYFDLVTTDEDGAVILRYDSVGFIWVETSERGHALNGMPADVHGHFGRERVLCHFEYLRREYEPAEDDESNGPRYIVLERTAAYRSAVAHPFHVSTYTGWADHEPTVVGFQTEAEARAYASGRPEPLIDLITRDGMVLAVRRMVRPMLAPHAMREPFVGRDDFPPMCWSSRCPTDPAYPHNEQPSCREASRFEE